MKELTIPTHRPPTSVGEMLRKEFLDPLGWTVKDLSKRTKLPIGTIMSILEETRPIDYHIAAILSKALGNSATFWLNLQHATNLYHSLNLNEETKARLKEVTPVDPLDRAAIYPALVEEKKPVDDTIKYTDLLERIALSSDWEKSVCRHVNFSSAGRFYSSCDKIAMYNEYDELILYVSSQPSAVWCKDHNTPSKRKVNLWELKQLSSQG